MSPATPAKRTTGEIRASAPARIDLAGGTLDLWPLYALHHPACTVHLAIERRATVRLRPRRDFKVLLGSGDTKQTVRAARLNLLRAGGPLPLHAQLVRYFAPAGGIELHTDSQVPAGSGLGGSSALALAMAAALSAGRRPRVSSKRLVATVLNLEAIVLGVPTGCQDYLAALEGGLGVVDLNLDEVRRHRLPGAARLAERLVLCYTGQSRASARNNWDIFRRRIEGDRRTTAALAGIREAAEAMRQALAAGDLDAGAEAMALEWRHRKRLTPEVSSRAIDDLIEAGRSSGALAAKLCGAGGGGALVFWCSHSGRAELEALLAQRRIVLLPFDVARLGLTVSE
jgi:D-glycero-alpha-D-manno-heptose-7-phosphate kinase